MSSIDRSKLAADIGPALPGAIFVARCIWSTCILYACLFWPPGGSRRAAGHCEEKRSSMDHVARWEHSKSKQLLLASPFCAWPGHTHTSRLHPRPVSSAAAIPYPELLAYAQSLSAFTSAPPNMPDLAPGQPPPPLFFPPFPNEEKMRRGHMSDEAPLGILGETHSVGKRESLPLPSLPPRPPMFPIRHPSPPKPAAALMRHLSPAFPFRSPDRVSDGRASDAPRCEPLPPRLPPAPAAGLLRPRSRPQPGFVSLIGCAFLTAWFVFCRDTAVHVAHRYGMTNVIHRGLYGWQKNSRGESNTSWATASWRTGENKVMGTTVLVSLRIIH